MFPRARRPATRVLSWRVPYWSGKVLVRSVWRAEVELMPWEPRFEIVHRRVVPATDLLSHLWMEGGFEPIYCRALVEAGLMSG